MKRLFALLMTLLLLPVFASAKETVIINRITNLTEEYKFPEGTPVLEIVFPRVYSSDCTIVRFGYDTMMIDASTASEEMQDRIRSALRSMGVDYIDVAFNSHPMTTTSTASSPWRRIIPWAAWCWPSRRTMTTIRGA